MTARGGRTVLGRAPPATVLQICWTSVLSAYRRDMAKLVGAGDVRPRVAYRTLQIGPLYSDAVPEDDDIVEIRSTGDGSQPGRMRGQQLQSTPFTLSTLAISQLKPLDHLARSQLNCMSSPPARVHEQRSCQAHRLRTPCPAALRHRSTDMAQALSLFFDLGSRERTWAHPRSARSGASAPPSTRALRRHGCVSVDRGGWPSRSAALVRTLLRECAGGVRCSCDDFVQDVARVVQVLD